MLDTSNLVSKLLNVQRMGDFKKRQQPPYFMMQTARLPLWTEGIVGKTNNLDPQDKKQQEANLKQMKCSKPGQGDLLIPIRKALR